jgi:hypothetical protein
MTNVKKSMAKGIQVAGTVIIMRVALPRRSSWHAVYVRARIKAEVKIVAPVRK